MNASSPAIHQQHQQLASHEYLGNQLSCVVLPGSYSKGHAAALTPCKPRVCQQDAQLCGAARVVQRLLEYCSQQDVRQEVLKAILENAVALASNTMGNYVIQHVIQHGSASAT